MVHGAGIVAKIQKKDQCPAYCQKNCVNLQKQHNQYNHQNETINNHNGNGLAAQYGHR
jgi:hypothetical protein